MTDKEKIKEEIESYKESMKGLEPHSDFRRGQITAYNQIMQFIDSLPEEPKKQPKYRVGDTIKGPCNNIFQVKEVLDKQYVLHSENGDELNSIEFVDKSSCLAEEPASEDLDREYDNYFKEHEMDIVLNPYSNCKDIARHFAEWQKQKMMEGAVDATILDIDAQTIEFGLWPEKLLDIKEGDKVKLIIIKE